MCEPRSKPAQQLIDVSTAQLRLMILWLVGVTPSFVLLVVRTLGPNSLEIQKIWGWLLASSMPTLFLVVGTYAAAARESKQDKSANRTFYNVTSGISVAYLLILNAAVICCPLSNQDGSKVLDTISLVLGPVQGLASASLGVFFVSQRTKPAGDALAAKT